MTVPYSKEAEQALIAALFIGDGTIAKIADILTPEDFFVERHRDIYREALKVFEQGKTMDPVGIVSKVTRKSPDEIMPYVKKLLDSIHTSAGAVSLASTIKDLSRRRRLIHTCNRIIQECENEHDPEALRGKLSGALADFLEGDERKTLLQAQELTEKTSQFLKEAATGKAGVIRTGLAFDGITGGFFPGELWIIAGRPGMGKTALALNICHRCAKQGHMCLFFSAEMSATQIGLRLLSLDSGVRLRGLRMGSLTSQEKKLVSNSLKNLSKLPIVLDESTGPTSVDIRARAQKVKAGSGLDLVFVDYLQLVGGAKQRYENRETEIAGVAESLKNLARELGVVVIAAAQLNRRVEERADKRPQLADLRYSGEIEQAADVVAFIYREELYNPSKTDGETEIIIAKNRNGDTGVSKLIFKKEITRFQNPSQEEE